MNIQAVTQSGIYESRNGEKTQEDNQGYFNILLWNRTGAPGHGNATQ